MNGQGHHSLWFRGSEVYIWTTKILSQWKHIFNGQYLSFHKCNLAKATGIISNYVIFNIISVFAHVIYHTRKSQAHFKYPPQPRLELPALSVKSLRSLSLLVSQTFSNITETSLYCVSSYVFLIPSRTLIVWCGRVACDVAENMRRMNARADDTVFVNKQYILQLA